MKSVLIRNTVNKAQRTGQRTEDIYFSARNISYSAFTTINPHSARRHELRVDHRTKVILSILPDKNIGTTSCVTLDDTTPVSCARFFSSQSSNGW
jgi:hypothetical protein